VPLPLPEATLNRFATKAPRSSRYTLAKEAPPRPPKYIPDVTQSLAKRCNISNDTFIRTTDAAHKEGVQHAWYLLREHGYVYESKHEGWYSVSDETFYPEGGVHLVLDPATGRKMMASIETGKEVEWTSEVNYHFKLSAFQKPLLDFFKENPDWIKPKHRMDWIVQQVEEGLQDLSVSRPTERLSWGIRVPDDPSQTIYVWLDALLNYMTAAGYPWTPGQEHALGWPADVHVIGKDIIRFHCIYWPAFLMALNIPLPKNVLTHAHWTLGRTGKMSKSSGNGVNPFFALDRFGVDAMRFYLAHDGGIRDDAAYDNEFVIERYKKNLHGGLGNLVSRIVRSKRWNVKQCVTNRAQHFRSAAPRDDSRNNDMYLQIQQTPLNAAAQMRGHDVPGALKTIFALVHSTNKYLQDQAPWSMKDAGSLTLEDCIFLCAESVRVTGILLQPFMPEKSKQLLDMLGVDEERRSFDWVAVGGDDSYGTSFVDLGSGQQRVLFPPLISEL